MTSPTERLVHCCLARFCLGMPNISVLFRSVLTGRSLLAVAVMAVVTACGSDVSVPSQSATDAAQFAISAPAPQMERVASSAMVSADGGAAGGVASAFSGQATATQPVMTPMIIRNGSASILVDSLELAITAVKNMAAALNGVVGNTVVETGDYQVRRATLAVQIPSARFDDALNGLKPIGKVESVTSTADDVGEEFVDVEARVANAKRLEDRMISLLATRTGKLEEVLAVERELARVREEIERYEGRLRYLRTRTATSTLTITVHERAPLVSATPGENILVDAFTNAWRNFVQFVAGFIAMLGFLIPLGVILVLVFKGWRKLRTRKEPKAP